jgi:hypothetical protein
MAETWLAKIKALETHIAAFQKTMARTRAETDTWRRLREELARIVRRPKGDLETAPPVTDNFPKHIERSWTADETALWDELRAELEAFRAKIRAELEAYRSKNPVVGERLHPPDKKSPAIGHE